MHTIQLNQLLPQVFAQMPDLVSEVWRQDVTLEKGKAYLIEASSGTGKSTLCSYLLGYRRDYAGHLRFDNRDARTLSVAEWTAVRTRHISQLFQELRLFPELTALENVLIKNELTHHRSTETIRSWFERLGIGDKIETPIGRMSFGQQQRVALMRALVQPFDFILADEPISHLDEHNAAEMASLLCEEAQAQGAGIIVTSIGKALPMDYDRKLQL